MNCIDCEHCRAKLMVNRFGRLKFTHVSCAKRHWKDYQGNVKALASIPKPDNYIYVEKAHKCGDYRHAIIPDVLEEWAA